MFQPIRFIQYEPRIKWLRPKLRKWKWFNFLFYRKTLDKTLYNPFIASVTTNNDGQLVVLDYKDHTNFTST